MICAEMLLEVACFNVVSATIAARAGATRIELCADRPSGGLTPTLADVALVKQQVHIPVMVMIRPRPGDFCYTDHEFAQMKQQMVMLDKLADGFVFGILDSSAQVDLERCLILTRLANRPCTFHRAFDQSRDFGRSLDYIIKAGFQSVLTSGGCADAVQGSCMLRDLVAQARDRIRIIVGGGVRSQSIEQLLEATAASAFHSAAIMGGGDGLTADEEEVHRLKAALTKHVSCTVPTRSM